MNAMQHDPEASYLEREVLAGVFEELEDRIIEPCPVASWNGAAGFLLLDSGELIPVHA